MRRFVIAALFLAATGLAGCNSGESTDPSELTPLTEQDKLEIQQRDAEIAAEEQAPI